jgi:hypothetical protein
VFLDCENAGPDVERIPDLVRASHAGGAGRRAFCVAISAAASTASSCRMWKAPTRSPQCAR